MSRWRVALRIAARDAWKHKVRSALVIALVSLPVLVVTAGLVIERTSDVNAVEALPRTLGNADALVEPTSDGALLQAPDGSQWHGVGHLGRDGDRPAGQTPTEADLLGVLGDDTRVLVHRSGELPVRTPQGEVDYVMLREFPVGDHLTDPLLARVSGAWPAGAGEVTVNEAFLALGYEVGDRPAFLGDDAPRIVGVVEHAALNAPVVVGEEGSLSGVGGAGQALSEQWLVETGPVTWDDVEALNRLGFMVTSRAVVLDPPARSELDPEIQWALDNDGSGEIAVVIALVVVMVLIQVALLAGPALAVTARQQSRTLALVAAAGGTPGQARLVVVAQGLVLGVGAALGGAVLGVGAGVALLGPAQRLESWQRFGPLDVPWWWIAGVVALGALSVFLAAVVPAWLTARQDPVAALAGRRADGAPDPRSPVLGVVLVASGLLGTLYAVTRAYMAEVVIAASTVVVVLGVLLLTPIILAAVARTVKGLPLPVRFAARDAARHRGRTVPAVAAVAATVAGVVALGIGASSDDLKQRQAYSPALAEGATSVTWWAPEVPGEETLSAGRAAARVAAAVEGVGADGRVMHGLSHSYGDEEEVRWYVSGDGSQDDWLLESADGSYGSTVLVADVAPDFPVGTGPDAGVDADLVAQVQEALDAGRAAVLTSRDVRGTTVTLVQETMVWNGDEGTSDRTAEMVLPATFVQVTGVGRFSAIVPSAVAEAEGLPVVPVGVYVADGLDEEQSDAVVSELVDTAVDVSVWTERGYEGADTGIVMLVLGAAGAVLMLVGTLTATFLALSDAKPDLATLGAVGASPRTRRGVGASYALLVGGVGAVLGVLIGLVPGFASAYVMTARGYWEGAQGPYFDVPWLLLAVVVVGLPLLTAAVIWASVRARMPMVARVD